MAQLPTAHWHLVSQLSGEGYNSHYSIPASAISMSGLLDRPVGKGCSHLFNPSDALPRIVIVMIDHEGGASIRSTV